MNPTLKQLLERQHYRVVGEHSAVKVCHWLKQRLIHQRCCYKETFYGISSHRCLQLTPVVNQCTQNCLYCWRYQGFTERELTRWDEPELILDDCIRAQRLLISGFKGDERCSADAFAEASAPRHVAISLAGEPALYPHLSAFIALCHRRGLTTFLVTNGTLPEALERLEHLPTQLYVTVAAPNEAVYKRLCNPTVRNGWPNLKRSLELLQGLNTRTVIRHTLVKDWNLSDAAGYAALDLSCVPDFIECKAYMFVGHSRERMRLENMPSHEEVKRFGMELAKLTGYELCGEREDSRVVLLARDRLSYISDTYII